MAFMAARRRLDSDEARSFRGGSGSTSGVSPSGGVGFVDALLVLLITAFEDGLAFFVEILDNVSLSACGGESFLRLLARRSCCAKTAMLSLYGILPRTEDFSKIGRCTLGFPLLFRIYHWW